MNYMKFAVDNYDEAKREDPLQYKYMRNLRLFSYTYGMWPGDALGENMSMFFRLFKKYVPFQATAIFIGEIIYLTRYAKVLDFFNIGEVWITTCLTVVVLVAEQVDTISHYYVLAVIPVLLSVILLYNVPSFWENVSHGAFQMPTPHNITLRFSINYEFPGFKLEDHFIFVTILNLTVCYGCTVIIRTMDLMLIMMMFQIIGHLLVLRRNLNDFPVPNNVTEINIGRRRYTVKMFSKKENEFLHRLIVKCVDHHRFIVVFVDEITTFFGPLLAFVCLFQLFSSCILLLECSKLDSQSLARFVPLTIVSVTQLLEISIIFEIVGSMVIYN
ncbi:unnamed protein product [Leptosia nina]|uniref:Odorant receptor n=1 Tax=Leptosia nina TaxID=320188 RepID=A0AAV1JZY9_9NEOP